MTFGFRGWIVALSCALALHATLLITLKPPTQGILERPAGAPVSVSGSLANVLGGATAVEVRDSETTESVETDEIAATSEHTEVKQTDITELESTQISNEPASNTVPDVAVEAVSSSVNAITFVQSIEARPVEEIKPLAVKTKAIRPTRATASKHVNRSVKNPKRLKKRTSRKTKKEKGKKTKRRPRRASKQSRAGSNKKGAAGSSRGGRGGKGRASAGAVRGYAARVRARILSRRPGAAGRGRVVISFAVTPSGGLRYASIGRSSGNASLDRAALSAVRRASPFPRPPQGASSHQLRFSIPFSFR